MNKEKQMERMMNYMVFVCKMVCAAVLISVSLPAVVFGQTAELTSASSAASVLERPLTEIPDLRNEWIKASPIERVKLAEQIGEAGAARFAETKGWKNILNAQNKAIRQGFDQVYTSGEIVQIVEAKGGTSPLQAGYGYKQGSSEWAVEAAKKTLQNHAASSSEKGAARLVLEAAAKKNLRVWTIRTPHLLGKPGAPVIESVVKCSEKAARLAVDYLAVYNKAAKSLAKAAEPAVAAPASITSAATSPAVKSAEGTKAASASKAIPQPLSKTTKVAKNLSKGGKALGVVGAAADAGIRAYAAKETEEDYQAGKITRQERNLTHAKNGAGLVGGWGGAALGAKGGAAFGATIGSVVPGPGTAVGGFLGGAVGAVGGYFCGEAAAEKGVSSIME